MSFLVYLLVIYFIQVLVHEGSHALAVLLTGNKLKTFWPFPGINKDKHITFGYIKYDCAPGTNSLQKAFISGAPLIANTIEFIIFLLLPVNYLSLGLLLCLFIDAANSSYPVIFAFKGSPNDLQKVERELGYNINLVLASWWLWIFIWINIKLA